MTTDDVTIMEGICFFGVMNVLCNLFWAVAALLYHRIRSALREQAALEGRVAMLEARLSPLAGTVAVGATPRRPGE